MKKSITFVPQAQCPRSAARSLHVCIQLVFTNYRFISTISSFIWFVVAHTQSVCPVCLHKYRNGGTQTEHRSRTINLNVPSAASVRPLKRGSRHRDSVISILKLSSKIGYLFSRLFHHLPLVGWVETVSCVHESGAGPLVNMQTKTILRGINILFYFNFLLQPSDSISKSWPKKKT